MLVIILRLKNSRNNNHACYVSRTTWLCSYTLFKYMFKKYFGMLGVIHYTILRYTHQISRLVIHITVHILCVHLFACTTIHASRIYPFVCGQNLYVMMK